MKWGKNYSDRILTFGTFSCKDSGTARLTCMLIHSTHLMPRYSLRGHFSTQSARSTLIIQKILCSCCLDYRRVWRRRNQSLHRTLKRSKRGSVEGGRSESLHIYCVSLMIRRILEASRFLRTN